MNLVNPYRFKNGIDLDLISYYEFAGNANDSVGSNNGTATSVTYPSGVVGNCADFTSSTSSIVTIPFATNNGYDTLDFADGINDFPFSVSLWVQVGRTGNELIFAKRDGASGGFQKYFLFYQASSNRFFVRFSDASSVNRLRKEFNTTLTANTWYHIVFTYDGSATLGGIKMYQDSVEITSTTSSLQGTYLRLNGGVKDLGLGNYTYSTSSPLNGKLDEVAFSRQEFTQEQIDYCYNQGLAGLPLI